MNMNDMNMDGGNMNMDGHMNMEHEENPFCIPIATHGGHGEAAEGGMIM